MISPATEKSDQLLHTETTFDLLVPAPRCDAALLFTPEGERKWAGANWDPQYLYPSGPARDETGAVFTIQHELFRAIWTVLRRDDEAGIYEYAYFVPDSMLTTVRVQFREQTAATTKVRVTYARTALSAAGNAQVQHMTAQDQQAGPAWQASIDQHLQT